MLPETIKIEVEGRRKTVATVDYVTAKKRQLVEFGYNNLTEKEVADQLEKILKHEKDLTVIGFMMEGDIML